MENEKINRIEYLDIVSNKIAFNEIIASFNKLGYIILDNIFDKEKIANLNRSFQENYNRYFEEKNHFDALTVGNKRYHVTITIDHEFNDLEIYANKFILEFMEKLLGNKFVIDDINCVVSLPNSKKMHVHRDGLIFVGSPIAHLLPPHAIGFQIPLIPFTKENGPTRYWPGTHRNYASIEESENLSYIEPEIGLGSAILMDYRLLHSGNPNLSNQVRPLLYINYCVNWYIDTNNFKKQAYYYMSEKIFKTIPDEYSYLFIRRNMKLSSTKK